MIQSIKLAAILLATVAAGYVCVGVPEAHSSTPAVEQYLVSQAPEELTELAATCTAAGCAARCPKTGCSSFRPNSSGGCTYICNMPSTKD